MEILDGVKPGEVVATSGLAQLYDGAPVILARPRPRRPPPSPSSMSLVDLCVRRPVFATMLIVALRGCPDASSPGGPRGAHGRRSASGSRRGSTAGARHDHAPARAARGTRRPRAPARPAGRGPAGAGASVPAQAARRAGRARARRSAPRTAPAPAPDPRPGVPAPPGVVEEIRAELAHAVERFQARDAEGVLQHISEEYWTGPLGKRAIRAQLVTLLQVHQQVRARVTLDEVRLVGQHAWVWTSGEITGQLAVVGTWVQLFVWERELEVARREQGVWRLYGYQQ